MRALWFMAFPPSQRPRRVSWPACGAARPRLMQCLTLGLAMVLPLMAQAGQQAQESDPELEFVERLREDVVGLDTLVYLPEIAPPAPCGTTTPATRAILTGANFWSGDRGYDLTATENDTDLLAKALVARGARASNILRLGREYATAWGFEQAAGKLLAATQCGDSVILHFSGWVMGPEMFTPASTEYGPFVEKEENDTLLDWATMDMGWQPANETIAKGPWIVLNQSDYGKADVLSAFALSDIVTRLRNRGADVTVILDTSTAEDLRLEDRQARVDPKGLWRTRMNPATLPPETQVLLNSQAGAFSVFYGTASGEITLEMALPAEDPEAVNYGAFSFSFAQSLLSAERSTPSAISRGLAQIDLGEGRTREWTYLVSTTDPDRDMIVERRPPATTEGGTIRILSPAETRAAEPLDQAEIVLKGQVDAPAGTMIVTVNGTVVPSTPEGGFEAPLTLQAGVNRVDILAMTRDNQPLTRSVELFYEGDMQALLGTGTRYALIISNQDYPDGSGLSDLRTPHGDAEALAAALTGSFGFQTSAKVDGAEVPLILRDATRIEIETALYTLSRVAGEKDTVLIFYAGHGLYETATDGAFWLPSDARMGLPFSYLPASAITEALLRINANNILVISDSCYSGALLRGAPEAAQEIDGDRLRALQRLSDKRSRVVIASGGNEPVLDGGGGAHSVFAEALLTGLAEMEDDAFSARELFDRYLLPMTLGRAAQEPQYRPIERSGHEGGDVVLARLSP